MAKTTRQLNGFRPSSARGCAAILVLAGVLGWSGAVHAAQLYRYTNAEGRVEISHNVPTDRVKYGYDVLDAASGRVLQTVAAQLTPAQAARKAKLEAEYQDCVRSQNRVRTLYQSEADIDYAEDKALEAIETRITNIQANLVQLRNQRAQLEERAAQLERSGHGLSGTIVANVQRAQTQIESLEQQILDRRAEQDETRERYALDRKTFNEGECVLTAVR